MKTYIKTTLALAALIAVGIPVVTNAAALNRQLEVGSTGSDVSTLQTFLAQDPTIYPQGLVTSYFGTLTKSAVSNFQARNGIPAVGRVGPMTLPVLNQQIANGMNMAGTVSSKHAPTIGNVSVNTTKNGATVSWTTDEVAKGVLYFSSSPLLITEYPESVSVVNSSAAMTDANFKSSQSIGLQNLQSNTTYHYMIHTTDQSGNVTVSWPTTFRTDN